MSFWSSFGFVLFCSVLFVMEEKDGQQQITLQMQENHPGREHEMTPTPSFIRSTYKLAAKLKVQLSDYSFYFSLYCQPIANSALPLICVTSLQ